MSAPVIYRKGKFRVTGPNRSGRYQIWADSKPHGKYKQLTSKICTNMRTLGDAIAWIDNHGPGWWAEHEEHSTAAQLGHLRRRGY